jgi:hypothetical protein
MEYFGVFAGLFGHFVLISFSELPWNSHLVISSVTAK